MIMKNLLGRVAPATRHAITSSSQIMGCTSARFYRDNDRFSSFKSYDQDSRQGGYRKSFNRSDENQRADNYTKNLTGLKTLTLEEIEDKSSIDDLRPRTAQLLKKNGIEELFPVQEAAFKLFVDGKELVVK